MEDKNFQLSILTQVPKMKEPTTVLSFLRTIYRQSIKYHRVITYILKGSLLNRCKQLINSKNVDNTLLSPQNGPNIVLLNLIKGLKKSKYPYLLNPSIELISPYVNVLSNPNALRWAINAKRNGKIRYLVAGPNLVVIPTEEEELLCANEIDRIITPCKWVSEWYISYKPELADKVVEWPVGIDTDYWKPARKRKEHWLIYDKTYYGKNEELIHITYQFIKKQIPFKVIRYGNYTHCIYKELLDKSYGVIILSNSESQGIAQFESWSCNVPTLIWDPGWFIYKNKRYSFKNISSSPYFCNDCGEKFNSLENFNTTWGIFKSKIDEYSPRDYVLKNFSLEKSAKAYIQIMNSNMR